MAPAELWTTLRAAPHSGICEIMHLAESVPDAIRLEVGQPDYCTPAHVVEAAKRTLDDGWHGYIPTAGLPSLRLAPPSERHRGTGGAGRLPAWGSRSDRQCDVALQPRR